MPASLESVGGQPGGAAIRDLLAVAHNDDGTLKNTVSVGPPSGVGAIDTANIQAAVNASASAGIPAFLQPGDYNCGGNDITVPAGASLLASPGTTRLLNARLLINGSAGAEVALSSPGVRGDTTLQLNSTTGLNPDDWLQVTSVINCGSLDAGVDQLCGRVNDNVFFAEFVKIKSVDSGVQITLSGPLTFDYSNTPGGSSGSRTTSTIRKITFAENITIQGFKMVGPGSTAFNTSAKSCILALFARNLTVKDCTIDANDTTGVYPVFLRRSLDCAIRDSTVIGRKTGAATSSDQGIVFSGSQRCVVSRCTIYQGFQGFDTTSFSYNADSASGQSGPSLDCAILDTSIYGTQNRAATDEGAALGTRFTNLRVNGCLYGVMVRGKNAQVTGCSLNGGSSTAGGIGITLQGSFIGGAIVANNNIRSYTYGVRGQLQDSVGGAAENTTLNFVANALIEGNFVDSCGTAAIALISPTNPVSVLHGVVIRGNLIRNMVGNRAIWVRSYNNGVTVEENVIQGVPTGQGGIQWEANSIQLAIGRNYVFGVAGTGKALIGVTTQITDLTTFPGGEAAAKLSIGEIFTDAATPFSNLPAVGDAAYKASADTVPVSVTGWAAIAAAAVGEKSVTVTGVAAGDVVTVGPPSGLNAGLVVTCVASAANTVKLRVFNGTAGSITPSDATWTFIIANRRLTGVSVA